jgi:RNA polymerase sigma-70 factor (ECF subfamily)
VLNDGIAIARFGELYAVHFNAVNAYVHAHHPTLDVDDVVQQTFLVAWSRLDKVPDGAQAREWLLRTATHVALNMRRADDRRNRFMDALIAAFDEEPVAAADLPIEDRELFVSVFGELRDIEQELLLLDTWEELTDGQIGTVLGLSQTTVAVRLHRARTKFRGLMASRTDP